MILLKEALRIVSQQKVRTYTECCSIYDVYQRVLAEDISADTDMPAFDRATVDGYACRKIDIQKTLTIIATIPAGITSDKTINEGECAKIMTGAPIPQGADCVVMREFSFETGNNKVRFSDNLNLKDDNIRKKGEDFLKQQIVLYKGDVLTSQQTAILASVGAAQVSVFKKPVISVISTGDELIGFDETLTIGKIRDSNGIQLVNQIKSSGAEPIYMGITKDDKKSLKTLFEKAFQISDIVLLSGGVSMGDYDYVPEVLSECGIEILFHKIAVKPGKPTLFGKKADKFVFGLAGNPVSSFVQFNLLVLPLVKKITGRTATEKIYQMKLGTDFRRTDSDRTLFIPVKITSECNVLPITYNSSGHIHAYTEADAMAEIPLGITEIKKGDYLNVRFL